MSACPSPLDHNQVDQLAALRASLAHVRAARGPALAFGLPELDERLADHGLDGAGLHEIAAASASSPMMAAPRCLPPESRRAFARSPV